MSSGLDELKGSECSFLATLQQIQRLLEPRQVNVRSSCDPLSGLVQQTQALASTTMSLVQKHALLAHQWQAPGSTHQKALSIWLEDHILQSLYKSLLDGALRLIFGTSALLRQFSPISEFAQLTMAVAQRLQQMALLCSPQNVSVLSFCKSFENSFLAQWNKADSQDYQYDNVRDILSHEHALVSPSLIDTTKFVKRDYFRLTLPKFGYHDILVELLQLSSGELAIFKVKSCRLPVESVEQMSQLFAISQTFKSLGLGRSLLFPSMRKDDFCIVSRAHSYIKLSSKTGNNVMVSLTAVDASHWKAHWEAYFAQMFSGVSLNAKELTSTTTHVTKSAHPLQNFRIKHDKLATLRPENNAGLGVSVAHNVAVPTFATERRTKTLLHKSKPLDTSLSSQMPALDTLADLENLDCESLLRLDQNISISASPGSKYVSDLDEGNFKRVDSATSVSRNEVSSGEYIEDCESFLSSQEDEEKQEEPFDLSSEFYRPQLTRRKSSSLLSLFSSNKSKTSLKNSKNLTLDLPAGNSTTSLLVLPTPASPNSIPLASPQRDEFCTIPEGINLREGFRICDHNVKVSYWHVNSWRAVSKDYLSIKLHETNDGKVLCLLSGMKEPQNLHLCAFVTPDWKVTRPAAQDVQLRIPNKSFAATALPAGTSVISLRCPQIEKLLNTLLHCIRQNLPSQIKASTTCGTMSASSSTFSSLDMHVSRSDTTSTGLSSIAQDNFSRSKEQTVSLLLLSNVKVRLHQRDIKEGWVLKSKGLLDVYSKETQGHVTALRFDIILDRTQKAEFNSKLNNIKRIGRTGVSLIHDSEDYLIEFKNQIVANEVYKLITCLI